MRALPLDVEAALRSVGWDPQTRDEARASRWALMLAGYATPDGRSHTIVPPAVEVFARYGGVEMPASDEGRQVAPGGFRLDPGRVQATVATLAALGATLHSKLTPIGDEGGGTGLLAIDGDGRVFVVDHTGDWFLGDTIEDALTALVLGIQPARIKKDGSW
jgi:SUKH-3 immunity protein